MTILTEETDIPARGPAAVIADYLRQSISVSYILGQIWSGRWLVVAGLVLGLAYGVRVVWTSSPDYSATMRISPAESDSIGGGGGSSGGGGNLLAQLAGGPNMGSVPKFTQFTLAIGSVGVAELLDKRYDMLCRLFHGECDIKTHTWRHRTGWNADVAAFWAWLGHLPDPNGPRTVIDLAGYIGGTVVVVPDKQNAVALLTYSNPKPEFAAEFLSKVFKATNDYIKQQNHDVQRMYVDYLTAAAARTVNVEQRQAIDALLLQDERQLMLTEVDVPYAAKIMDGPVVSPVDKVKKTLALNALIGLLIGLGVAACRNLVPRRWRFW